MESSQFGISKFYIRWTILGITLNWYENRVFYNNLKSEEALNVMSDEEVCYILHIYALYIEELDAMSLVGFKQVEAYV